MSAQFSNFKLKSLSGVLAAATLVFPSILFTQSVMAQNVSVFKCEKNGVTVYQSMKEGTDKTCTKFEVYIDPNASARASAASNIMRTSSSRPADLNSVASQVQRNRDLKKIELLSNELAQEEESLKGLINKASMTSDEKELKKINEQKTVTINNINAIKKELGPNVNQALQRTSNSDTVAFNLDQVAPSFAAPTSLPTLPVMTPTLSVRVDPKGGLNEGRTEMKTEMKTEVRSEPKSQGSMPNRQNHSINIEKTNKNNSSGTKQIISSSPIVKSTDSDIDPIALVKKFMSSSN